MNIHLFMEPGKEETWEDFCKNKPPFSVAFDGYVTDGPKFDLDGPYQNFNHHKGVSRMETRATCAQVRLAISLEFCECFRDENGPRVNMFTNSCDHDIALSVFQVRHPEILFGMKSKRLNRLVYLEDILDTTGGAYPYPEDIYDLRHVAWINEPYSSFRMSGELDSNQDPKAYIAVVDAIGERIQAYLDGVAGSKDLDTRFERMPWGGKHWTMVREIGADSRTGMYNQGIRAFISVRKGPGSAHTVSIGKMSPYARVKVPALLDRLNAIEKPKVGQWGGGNIIGGSPIGVGTSLPIPEIARIACEVWGPC